MSVIRSSLGSTYYPYCLYIRSLNLTDFNNVLDDSAFIGPVRDAFFEGDMAQFLTLLDTPAKRKSGRNGLVRLNRDIIIDLVGESITNYISRAAAENSSTAALEQLHGATTARSLELWTSRLSRLRSLQVWDGAIFNEKVAAAIHKNCFEFAELEMYLCSGEKVDHSLSNFLLGLRPNSITSFTISGSHNNIGSETFLGLSLHSKSLKTLSLDSLKEPAIKSLNLLQACDALEILVLRDAHGIIDLEATENDVYTEVVAWLRRCEKLRDLVFENHLAAVKLLTEVCLCHNIRLRKLDLGGYNVLGNQEFHRALAHQTSLEHLTLKGEGDGIFRDDIDIMISAISALKSLTELTLLGTSDLFSTREITALALALPQLVKLGFSGYGISDDVFPALATLSYLQELNISALTEFSVEGLINYVNGLGRGNAGMQLFVMFQVERYAFEERDVVKIRDEIRKRVDGRFDFELLREPNEGNFDSDSD